MTPTGERGRVVGPGAACLLAALLLTGEPALAQTGQTSPAAAEAGQVQPFFVVQVGAFGDPLNAEQLKREIEADLEGVSVRQITTKGEEYFTVDVGRFAERADALRQASQLRAAFAGAFVRQERTAARPPQEQPIVLTPGSAALPTAGAFKSRPGTVAPPAATGGQQAAAAAPASSTPALPSQELKPPKLLRPLSGSATAAPILKGILIAGRAKQAVKAGFDGVVTYSGEDLSPLGLAIVVQQDGWSTVYGDLGQSKVEIGQKVIAGETIGISSADGRLLFAVRHGSEAFDAREALGEE